MRIDIIDRIIGRQLDNKECVDISKIPVQVDIEDLLWEKYGIEVIDIEDD